MTLHVADWLHSADTSKSKYQPILYTVVALGQGYQMSMYLIKILC